MQVRSQDYQATIIRHYEEKWDNKATVCHWDKGPIDALPNDFRVLEFGLSKTRNMWTYSTCCLSQPEDLDPIELHVFSSIKDLTLVELLTTVAYYHRNTSMLGLDHTIYFGRPWQNNSNCKYGFISLPYLDGPLLENLTLSNTKIVKFYWLIPITKKEVDFKKMYGSEALELKFEDNGFNYLDPDRNSVI